MSKTTTHLLRAALLAAAATALLALRAGAQTPTDYNKRELMLQTLDQSRPNDYVPVFFNIHFKEHEGLDAVRAHVDWFRRTHVDFVNVKYEYFPPLACRPYAGRLEAHPALQPRGVGGTAARHPRAEA